MNEVRDVAGGVRHTYNISVIMIRLTMLADFTDTAQSSVASVSLLCVLTTVRRA